MNDSISMFHYHSRNYPLPIGFAAFQTVYAFHSFDRPHFNRRKEKKKRFLFANSEEVFFARDVRLLFLIVLLALHSVKNGNSRVNGLNENGRRNTLNENGRRKWRNIQGHMHDRFQLKILFLCEKFWFYVC